MVSGGVFLLSYRKYGNCEIFRNFSIIELFSRISEFLWIIKNYMWIFVGIVSALLEYSWNYLVEIVNFLGNFYNFRNLCDYV